MVVMVEHSMTERPSPPWPGLLGWPWDDGGGMTRLPPQPTQPRDERHGQPSRSYSAPGRRQKDGSQQLRVPRHDTTCEMLSGLDGKSRAAGRPPGHDRRDRRPRRTPVGRAGVGGRRRRAAPPS
jgi:hypothetical protein